jgi:hypothetical protein
MEKEGKILQFPQIHRNELTYSERVAYHLSQAIDMMVDSIDEEEEENLQAAILNTKAALWFWWHHNDEM